MLPFFNSICFSRTRGCFCLNVSVFRCCACVTEGPCAQELYNRKLWHELTLKLEDAVTAPEFQQARHRLIQSPLRLAPPIVVVR